MMIIHTLAERQMHERNCRGGRNYYGEVGNDSEYVVANISLSGCKRSMDNAYGLRSFGELGARIQLCL